MVETLFLTAFLYVDHGSMPISEAWPLFAMMTVVNSNSIGLVVWSKH
jgi:hypothetical protein